MRGPRTRKGNEEKEIPARKILPNSNNPRIQPRISWGGTRRLISTRSFHSRVYASPNGTGFQTGPGLKIDAVHAVNAPLLAEILRKRAPHLLSISHWETPTQLEGREGRENACALVRVNPLSCRFLPRCCRDFTNFLGEGAGIIGVVPAWREGRGGE
jgi:hypothetical protein